MSKSKKFSLNTRIKSFKYAIDGLKDLFMYEHNARIHFFVAIIAVMFGFILKISSLEWIGMVICIGLVIITETLNTSIERIADFVSPQRHQEIKVIKDLSAAAVLISVVVAVIVGLIIFLPKLLILI